MRPIEDAADEVKSVRQQKQAIAAGDNTALYADRVRVYPKAVSGSFRALK